MTVRITTENGIDVTEGVQAAYDLVFRSMDWGSGFWTIEDIEPVIRVAVACGYDTAEIEPYLAEPAIGYGGATDETRAKARAQMDAIRREVLGEE